jgi:hypothetical protein
MHINACAVIESQMTINKLKAATLSLTSWPAAGTPNQVCNKSAGMASHASRQNMDPAMCRKQLYMSGVLNDGMLIATSEMRVTARHGNILATYMAVTRSRHTCD